MAILYPITEEYKQKIQQPARQFAGRVLIPKLTATFTRNSIAYKQDGTQVGINEPRFEEGQFGKAVMVEEGAANLLSNPGFESGDTGWTKTNATIENVAGWQGSWRGRMALTGSEDAHAGLYQSVAVTTGQSYTLSAYAKRLSGGKPATYLIIQWEDSGGIISQDLSPNLAPSITGDWKRFSLTATAPTDAVSAEVYCYVIRGAAVDIVWDAVQFENKPYATSFIDGTRSRETLTIPTAGVLNPQEGTVECWVYVNDVVKRKIANNWTTVVLIRKGSSVANWIWLYHNPAGIWVLQIRKEDGQITGSGHFSNSLTPDGWHYFAIRWNTQEGSAELFHNGVKRISLANVIFPAEYDRIEIGYRQGGSSDWLNSLIADLRISQRARTDEEILETYGRGL